MIATAIYQESAQFILQAIKERPTVGIILGSGLGRLAQSISQPVVIPYASIPHFPQATAPGHEGNLIYGLLGGKRVICMQGRFHNYEGYGAQEVTFPIRVMKLLGVETLFVSNAAGGINPTFRVGDLMVITDHINLLPNPLIGPNNPDFGVRFPDMTHVYCKDLIRICQQQAARLDIPLQFGVYLGGTGPSYETKAEYKYFRVIGADAVGMSTVPEVIAARHCGLRVFGMSVISNQAVEFDDNYKNDEQDVINAANAAAQKMCLLFTEIIANL